MSRHNIIKEDLASLDLFRVKKNWAEVTERKGILRISVQLDLNSDRFYDSLITEPAKRKLKPLTWGIMKAYHSKYFCAILNTLVMMTRWQGDSEECIQ